MKRLICASVLTLALVMTYGCSFLKPYPAIREFSLNPNVNFKHEFLGNVTIRISAVACPAVFDNLFIYKVKRGFIYEPFPSAEWTGTVCSMVALSLKKAFLSRGFNVVDYGRTKYVLLFTVNKFYGEEGEKKSYAVVDIDFWLKKSNKVVGQFDIYKAASIKAFSPYNTVKKLNLLLAQAEKEVVTRVVGLIKVKDFAN